MDPYGPSCDREPASRRNHLGQQPGQREKAKTKELGKVSKVLYLKSLKAESIKPPAEMDERFALATTPRKAAQNERKASNVNEGGTSAASSAAEARTQQSRAPC